jgi:hypothetical protein
MNQWPESQDPQQPPHNDTPDFQHGYTSGMEQVDRNTYENYVSSRVHFEQLGERLADKRRELDATDQEVALTRNQQKTSFDTLQNHLLQGSVAGKEVDRLEAAVSENEAATASLTERRERATSKYSLFAGLLYFVAGVAFVVGDLIISHEIVAYALNIRNNIEAWSFAVGLAMVSILLKPAYERLIEGPYLENHDSPTVRKRYAWFKGGLVVFSLATLFILGWFRYEAYRTDRLKQDINKTIKSIQLQQDPNNPNQVNVLTEVEDQLQKMDALNQGLVTSVWALASFVLSGILFAIAGAVCLGIAFPVLQAYWFRWLQAGPRLQRLRKQRVKLVDELRKAEAQLAVHLTQKAILENELAQLPRTESLETRRLLLTQELHELLEERRLAETDSRIAAYNDGYGKGNVTRQWMDEKELEQFKSNHFSTQNLASKARSSGGGTVPNGRKNGNGLRPHQMLRKYISDQFEGEGE